MTLRVLSLVFLFIFIQNVPLSVLSSDLCLSPPTPFCRLDTHLHSLIPVFGCRPQVHLSDGHPGEEREVVLPSADGGHRGAHAHSVHAHSGPGLHAVRTHLQETQVRP